MTARARTCWCGIEDWRGLRLAMGLSERTFCALTGLDRHTLYRLEHPGDEGHRCPHRAVALLLHIWMHQPEYRRRLEGAGVPIPPEPPLRGG